jgi:predicted DNA-binding ribbon-helix-helix protein
MFAGQEPENYEYQSRSLRLNGQSTSLRLEKKFWRVLDEIARSEDTSTPLFISQLHGEVVALHGEARNFSSLLRCACLVYLEKRQQSVETDTNTKTEIGKDNQSTGHLNPAAELAAV